MQAQQLITMVSEDGVLHDNEDDALLNDGLRGLELKAMDNGDNLAPVSARLAMRLETAREREQAAVIGKAIATRNAQKLVRLLKNYAEGPPLALARVLESINDMMQEGGMDSKESVLLRDELFIAGLTENVAATMAAFPLDADVAAFGARAVGCIAYAPPPVPISLRKGPRPTTGPERAAAKAAGIDLNERKEMSSQEQRRERLLAIGAVDTLFELLRTHAGDEEVQENGLWAVGNIARHLEEEPSHQ